MKGMDDKPELSVQLFKGVLIGLGVAGAIGLYALSWLPYII